MKKILGIGLRLGRAGMLSAVMNLPAYFVNLASVSFMLWHFGRTGLGNFPFVIVGDFTAYAVGIPLFYFVLAKNKTIRKWSGSNEKDVCPHCGAQL